MLRAAAKCPIVVVGAEDGGIMHGEMVGCTQLMQPEIIQACRKECARYRRADWLICE